MKHPDETVLTREQAWQMYLEKLDEEANYFSVKDEEDEEEEEGICTCVTCIVSIFTIEGVLQSC